MAGQIAERWTAKTVTWSAAVTCTAYFVSMRGAGEYRTWSVPLDEAGVSLWGEEPQPAAGHIQAWDRDHRTGPGPVLTVHPAGTPADDLPSGHVLNKRHSTIVLSWPEPAR